MTAQPQIHAELFCRYCCPMRRFAGNESVDAFRRDPINLRAACPRNNSDRLRSRRTEVERLDLISYRPFQHRQNRGAVASYAGFYAHHLTFLLKKRISRSKPQSARQQRVVTQSPMNIERQMRAIQREIVLERDSQLSSQNAGNRLKALPKQTVMHDQEVDAAFCREGQGAGGSVHGGSDLVY